MYMYNCWLLFNCVIFNAANSRKRRKQPLGEEECQLPREPDEFFYYEKLFSENEEEIKSNDWILLPYELYLTCTFLLPMNLN